jgi:hypothetical protein
MCLSGVSGCMRINTVHTKHWTTTTRTRTTGVPSKKRHNGKLLGAANIHLLGGATHVSGMSIATSIPTSVPSRKSQHSRPLSLVIFLLSSLLQPPNKTYTMAEIVGKVQDALSSVKVCKGSLGEERAERDVECYADFPGPPPGVQARDRVCESPILGAIAVEGVAYAMRGRSIGVPVHQALGRGTAMSQQTLAANAQLAALLITAASGARPRILERTELHSWLYLMPSSSCPLMPFVCP